MKDEYQELKDMLGEKPEKADPFERYGFLRNPFPKASETTAEPFYNQDEVRKAFLSKFSSFARRDGEVSDRLLIFGDQRVGKTNFSLHWQRQISKLLEDGILDGFIPLYLTVASDNFMDDIHRSLVMELSKVVLPSFFETMLQKRDSAFPGQDDDFTRAVVATVKLDTYQREMFADTDIRLFENIRLFAKWFSGERCTQSELKALGGVFSCIDTSSLAIKYFRDFIRLAREHKVLKGLIVFLDEFELIFGKAMAASKRVRYLQDLRHFMDMLQEGILLIVASSPAILTEFQRDYVALKNRFGETQELQAIQSLDKAKGYAQAYLHLGREAYGRESRNDFETIITDEEIADVYEEVRKEYAGAQGWFFAKLFDRVEEKVRKQEGRTKPHLAR